MTPPQQAQPIAKSPLNHPRLHPNRIKLQPISGFRTAYSISQMRLCLKCISNLALLLSRLILLFTSNTSNSCNSNSRRNISKCSCSQWECNHRRHNPILTTYHRYLLKLPSWVQLRLQLTLTKIMHLQATTILSLSKLLSISRCNNHVKCNSLPVSFKGLILQAQTTITLASKCRHTTCHR